MCQIPAPIRRNSFAVRHVLLSGARSCVFKRWKQNPQNPEFRTQRVLRNDRFFLPTVAMNFAISLRFPVFFGFYFDWDHRLDFPLGISCLGRVRNPDLGHVDGRWQRFQSDFPYRAVREIIDLIRLLSKMHDWFVLRFAGTTAPWWTYPLHWLSIQDCPNRHCRI